MPFVHRRALVTNLAVGAVASLVPIGQRAVAAAEPLTVVGAGGALQDAATLRQFDRTLVRAAYNLGAGPTWAFLTVTLPLIAPGVISGALFAFVFSFDEVVISLFIAGPAQRTLPRQMFDGIRDDIDPSILAMSTLLNGVSVIMLTSVGLLSRRTPAKTS